MGRTRRVALAGMAALIGIGLTGCSGSVLFPTQAVLPATLEQAYDEVKDHPESTDLSAPTRAFLSGFDPAAARPSTPRRPIEPRPSALAAERFTLADLAMAARPADGTACSLIADQVGGGKARCAQQGDAALNDDLPAGVPTGSYVVGKAYGDGRMVLLNQPGEGGEMWDAAMHERGHLYATWLCGRADCLNSKFVARGYRDSSSYLASLTEGFAQSWAQCHGARKRSDYVVLACPDVTDVVAAALADKTAAKQDFESAKKAYDESMATYEQQMREYDERGRQIDVLAKVTTGLKAAASPTSS
ncbi:MAG: hypothetical protein M9891_16540 [Austwickia sp.]|nr:hypothetical protein [Austwickia sp.]MCO5310861.1 hypothetical protein [Austwickia sp.]